MRSEKCRVVARMRPLQEGEVDCLASGAIQLPAPGRVLVGKEFEVDRVYLPGHDSTAAVYEDEVAGLVSSLYDGFNCTIFAYGASGSGKTHTVLGAKHRPGLIDHIIDDVFARYDQRTCTVQVSVEELYCERFTDLLAPVEALPPICSATSNSSSFSSTTSSGSLSARMRGVGGAHSAGSSSGKPPLQRREGGAAAAAAAAAGAHHKFSKATLTSSCEMKTLVHNTLRKRHTASTCLNDKSSRSHVIVTISLEQRKQVFEHRHSHAGGADEGDGAAAAEAAAEAAAGSGSDGSAASTAGSAASEGGDAADAVSLPDSDGGDSVVAGATSTYLIGKLYLVDLAGSENIKRSGAEGARQQEAGVINKSLCHLKSVIEEVFKGQRVSTFRNSKLTFRLQDALGGGNSKLLVIACISTAKDSLAETKETLRFAEMARSITNTPVVNREPKDELIIRLQMTVDELQDQLRLAKAEGSGKAATDSQLLQQQLHAVEAAYAELREEMETKEAALAKWVSSAASVRDKLAALHDVLSATQASEASLKQQLSAQQAVSSVLQRQLAAEQAALHGSQAASAAAAELMASMADEVVGLHEQCSVLQQQLSGQQDAAATALGLCAEQQHAAQHLQLQAAAQAGELAQLTQQLQQERAARAAAEQQVQDQAAAAQLAASTAAADLQALASVCEQQQHEVARQHEAALAAATAAHAAQHAEWRQQLEALQAQHAAALAAARERHAQQLDEALQSNAQRLTAEKLRCRQHLNLGMRSVMEDVQSLARDLAAPGGLTLPEGATSSSSGSGDAPGSPPGGVSVHGGNLTVPAVDLSLTLAAAATPGTAGGAAADATDGELTPVAQAGGAFLPLPVAAAAEGGGPLLQGMSANPLYDEEGLHLGSEDYDDEAEAHGSGDCSDITSSSGSSGAGGMGHYGLQRQTAAATTATTAALVAAAAAAAAGTVTKAAAAAARQRLASNPASPASVSVYAEAASRGSSDAGWPGGSPLRLFRSSAGGPGGSGSKPGSRAGSVCGSPLTDGGSAVQSPARSVRGLPPLVRHSAARRSLAGVSRHGSSHSIASSVADDTTTSSSVHGDAVASGSAALERAVTQAAAAAAASVTQMAATAVHGEMERQRQQQASLRGFAAGSWPTSYARREEVDAAAAAAAFSQLRGGPLTVEGLQAFLEHRMLGGRLHTKTLCGGQRKRKHELMQDMLAYHRCHLASGSKAAGGSSSGGGRSSGSGRAAAAVPSPSKLRSNSSALATRHPLSADAGAPAAGGAAAGIPSPATPQAPAAAAGQGKTAAAAPAAPASAAKASSSGGGASAGGSLTELADTGASPQAQGRHRAGDQQQQASPASRGGSPGARWSWLTPHRRKQASILGQLSGGECGRSSGPSGTPAPPPQPCFEAVGQASPQGAASTELARVRQKPQLRLGAVEEPAWEAAGEQADAVSPRDKRHAAAAGRSGGPGAAAATPPPRQASGAGALTGSRGGGGMISACTGSVVSQLYVDSPAVKLAPSSSRAPRKEGGGGGPGAGDDRLVAQTPAAHRSNWRQAQLAPRK